MATGKEIIAAAAKNVEYIVKLEVDIERLKKLLRKHNICPACGKQLSPAEAASVHTCYVKQALEG